MEGWVFSEELDQTEMAAFVTVAFNDALSYFESFAQAKANQPKGETA
jgi:hypothetical protein